MNTSAVACPATITVKPHEAFAMVPYVMVRGAFRSPARTKRRWTRDHKRMMRERARRGA